MTIKGYMKKKVFSIPETATIAEAAAMFVEKRVGLLPVVNPQGIPVGVVRMLNLISLELPDFLNLVEDFDFVNDFGALELINPDPEVLSRSITTVMQPVDTIEEDCGLLRVFAIMLHGDFSDLPVTNESGELVGIVSRVDIGRGILSDWPKE